MHSGILFALTVLLGQICVSNGVKCYSCTYTTVFSSASNANCNEGAKFNGQNMTTEECSGKCSKVRGGLSTSLTLTRGCNSACVSANGAGVGMWCCETDFCNDSWQTKASLTTAVAAVLAAYLLRAV